MRLMAGGGGEAELGRQAGRKEGTRGGEGGRSGANNARGGRGVSRLEEGMAVYVQMASGQTHRKGRRRRYAVELVGRAGLAEGGRLLDTAPERVRAPQISQRPGFRVGCKRIRARSPPSRRASGKSSYAETYLGRSAWGERSSTRTDGVRAWAEEAALVAGETRPGARGGREDGRTGSVLVGVRERLAACLR